MTPFHENGGFTLVELIFVLVVLSVLAASALPMYADLKAQAQKAVANSVVGILNSAEYIVYAKSKLDESLAYGCSSVAGRVAVSGISGWSVDCASNPNKAIGSIGGTFYEFTRDGSTEPGTWRQTTP